MPKTWLFRTAQPRHQGKGICALSSCLNFVFGVGVLGSFTRVKPPRPWMA
jgi:hypothetical protein